MSYVNKRLALCSLGQLNTVLVNLGYAPHETKTMAAAAVALLIESSTITLDAVIATEPGDYQPATNCAEDARLSSAIEAAKEAQVRVLDVEMNVDKKLCDLSTEFNRLSNALESQVRSLARPDESAVANQIHAAVAQEFKRFRKAVPVEAIEVLAASVGTFELRTARDVFGSEATHYLNGEQEVCFGDMLVGVWNDPNCPALVDDYVFQPHHLHQALIALDDPLPDNIWLAGERGTGKTEFVAQLAARLQRSLFRVNFDEALERADFIGGNSIESSSVVWKPGVIVQAIRQPGAIVLLDEIGFARAQSLAALHALCERSPHRSITISETGERIPVAEHVVFFGADNSNGHGDTSGNFAGVREQNTAFLDRFSFTLRFEYLGADQERDLIAGRTGLSLDAAEMIVSFASVAREKARAGLLTQPPSLRQLFAWARAVHRGLPVDVAFQNAIVNKFPVDCTAELLGVFASHINIADFRSAIGGHHVSA